MEYCLNQTSNTDPGQSTVLIEWQNPPATDNSGDGPTVVCNPPSGTNFTIGSTIIICTALDGYGNKDNCLFFVDIIGKILCVLKVNSKNKKYIIVHKIIKYGMYTQDEKYFRGSNIYFF